MKADIADPLLCPETGIKEDAVASRVHSWSCRQRYFVVAVLCLSGSGLLCLGATRATRSTKANPMASFTDLFSGWGDASCYTFTGGTCMVYNCDTARGATCSSDHNCYCASGCTGADGICRSQESYKLVASNVRLRNVKYSDQYMYAPRSWFMEQLRVTDAKGKYADLWNIYKLPGKDFIWHNDMYFLSPVEFPEYVAGVATTKMEAYVPSGNGGGSGSNSGGFVIPMGSIFVVDLFHLSSRHLLANRDPYNIASVMNTLCRPREKPEAIQISGTLGQATWYIHHASWEVFAWVWSQPGESGQWVPEPPINASLPFC